MKRLLVMVLTVLPFYVFAQAPDNNAIETQIMSQGSPYYYPNLLNKYLIADTTLTLEDYRHLYYGFVFTSDYQPYKFAVAPRELGVLNKNNTPSTDDYKSVVKALNRTLSYDPFNLQNLNLLTYVYGILGEHDNEIKSSRRFKMLMNAIMSSGSGIDEKLPWYIIYRSQSEDVMLYLNKHCRKPIIISVSCEYLPLFEKENGVKGYYFDFGAMYTHQPNESEHKKSPWEFNGIKIR